MKKSALAEEMLTKNKRSKDELFDYCVYALWNGDELVYIGMSIQPFGRITTHSRTKEFTHYSIHLCESEEEMMLVESELIMKHKPLYNKAISSGYVSLDKLRSRIRSISEEHKYSSKYYIPKIRKVLNINNIEIKDYKGKSCIRESDVPIAMGYILGQN